MHKPEPMQPENKHLATVQTLAKEAAALGTRQLADYLKGSRREIEELYRANNSWTTILRRAGLVNDDQPRGEAGLLKRIHAFLHVDDAERAEAYEKLLRDDAPSYESLPPREQTFAKMLFFNLWDKAGGFGSYAQGLETLREQREFRSELRQVLAYVTGRARRHTIALGGVHARIPLRVHSEYNRSEILAAMGVARLGGQMPGTFGQGVLWDEANKTDILLITLNKQGFSPTVSYKDHAVSSSEFAWESQNSTTPSSPTGLRYREHVQRGTHVLLFMRTNPSTSSGKAQPWMLLGPATYDSHKGSKPMAIRWRLHHELPADVRTDASSSTSAT